MVMSNASDAVNPEQIARCEKLIRPYIRRTPVVEIDAADVGLAPGSVFLKLELFQHSGSFKARGAFANLLARKVPAAGVVAASGSNQGQCRCMRSIRTRPCWDRAPSASNLNSRPGSTRCWSRSAVAA